mgnify:FL=1
MEGRKRVVKAKSVSPSDSELWTSLAGTRVKSLLIDQLGYLARKHLEALGIKITKRPVQKWAELGNYYTVWFKKDWRDVQWPYKVKECALPQGHLIQELKRGLTEDVFLLVIFDTHYKKEVIVDGVHRAVFCYKNRDKQDELQGEHRVFIITLASPKMSLLFLPDFFNLITAPYTEMVEENGG